MDELVAGLEQALAGHGTVVLLAGDGGFVTAVGELATAAQEKARVRIVLFNDGGYGILRNLQDTHF